MPSFILKTWSSRCLSKTGTNYFWNGQTTDFSIFRFTHFGLVRSILLRGLCWAAHTWSMCESLSQNQPYGQNDVFSSILLWFCSLKEVYASVAFSHASSITTWYTVESNDSTLYLKRLWFVFHNKAVSVLLRTGWLNTRRIFHPFLRLLFFCTLLPLL